MRKVLVVMAVLLAAIVPSLTAWAIDLNKVVAAAQIVNAFRGVSNKELKAFGENADKQMLDQCQTTSDGLAQVQRIVARLEPDSTKRPVSRVIDSDDKNAAMTPGFVYVNIGLQKVMTEDELAAVLAHEKAHNDDGHVKSSIKRLRKAQGVQGILTLAGASDGLRNIVGAGSILKLLDYQRDQEYQADIDGRKIAIARGFPSNSMLNALKKLRSDGKKNPEFLSNHPDLDKRIARLQSIEDEENPRRQERRVERQIAEVGEMPSYPMLPGAIAVKVIDNGGGGSFFGSMSSEEAIRTEMEDALHQTKRFDVPDQHGRQDAWEEQDTADTGRMDPATLPDKGKTVAAKYFLYVTISFYDVTQEGQVRFGSWGKSADLRLVKAQIKGKVKFEPVEKSILDYSTNFKGSEVGHETEASYSKWTSGADVSWSSHPAGQAVEEACRTAVRDLVEWFDALPKAMGAVTLHAGGEKIGININPDKCAIVGSRIVFKDAKGRVIAKYRVTKIDGQNVSVETELEKVRPTTERFKIL